jgi:hypothetical protein
VNALAMVLAGAAVVIVLMNYAFVGMSAWHAHRGTARRHSDLPLVAQVLAILADRAASVATPREIPASWLLVIGVSDISLWLFLWSLWRRR